MRDRRCGCLRWRGGAGAARHRAERGEPDTRGCFRVIPFPVTSPDSKVAEMEKRSEAFRAAGGASDSRQAAKEPLG